MKYELMRLEKFNNNLKISNNIIWTNKDYYKYWDRLETLYKNIKHKNITSTPQ